jgi:hypothetical protein
VRLSEWFGGVAVGLNAKIAAFVIKHKVEYLQ